MRQVIINGLRDNRASPAGSERSYDSTVPRSLRTNWGRHISLCSMNKNYGGHHLVSSMKMKLYIHGMLLHITSYEQKTRRLLSSTMLAQSRKKYFDKVWTQKSLTPTLRRKISNDKKNSINNLPYSGVHIAASGYII